jgi:hypothetical protein
MSAAAGTASQHQTDVRRAGGRPTAAALFVGAVWACVVAANLAAVARYSPRSVPVSDEFLSLGDGADLSLRWLWEQHAEHRIPLPKLLWMGVLRLSGYDFRIGNFLQVLGAGLVAWVLIRAAARLRGGTRLTDAFFPLALLNIGQTYPVFLWWWQVNHTLAPLLACLLLVLIVRRARPCPREMAWAGVLLLLLALSGPGGLPYVPTLGLWLGGICLHEFHSSEPARRRSGLAALALAATAVLLTGLYFVGFDRANAAPGAAAAMSADGVRAASKTALKLWSVSLGTVTRDHWKAWGGAALLLWLSGFSLAIFAWRSRPAERTRALGLLLFLAAGAALLAVLGWARANSGDDNTFEGHYLSKGVPALGCVYFLWEIYGGRIGAWIAQAALFAAASATCALTLADADPLLAAARARRANAEAMDRDARQGRSPYELYERYKQFQGYAEKEPLFVAGCMRYLRDTGVGPFRHLVLDREIPYHGAPIAVNQLVAGESDWQATGDDPFLTYRLEPARRVSAIRLKLAYAGDAELPIIFQCFWKRPGDDGFSEQRCFTAQVPTVGPEWTVAVPVLDAIDGFRIDPADRPCRFRLTELVLLVPHAESTE